MRPHWQMRWLVWTQYKETDIRRYGRLFFCTEFLEFLLEES